MLTIHCGNAKFENIQAIFFDKNGTLEDSEVYLRSLGQKVSRLIDAQIPGIGEPLLMAYGINGNTLDHRGLMAVASRRETEIATAAYIAETGRGWFESLKIARQYLDEAEKYTHTTPATTISRCSRGFTVPLISRVKAGYFVCCSHRRSKRFCSQISIN